MTGPARTKMALTGEVRITPAIKITTYNPLPSKGTTKRTERAIVCRAVTENYPASWLTAGPPALGCAYKWISRAGEHTHTTVSNRKTTEKEKKTEEKQAHGGANKNTW